MCVIISNLMSVTQSFLSVLHQQRKCSRCSSLLIRARCVICSSSTFPYGWARSEIFSIDAGPFNDLSQILRSRHLIVVLSRCLLQQVLNQYITASDRWTLNRAINQLERYSSIWRWCQKLALQQITLLFSLQFFYLAWQTVTALVEPALTLCLDQSLVGDYCLSNVKSGQWFPLWPF